MDQVLDIARWTTEDPTVIAGMVNMLEQVVRAMMVGSDAERDMAQGVLTNLKDHMESWKCVANILDDKFTQDQPTKFFGLQILEEAIKYRWKVLPAEQREGIKGYVVELCIKMSQDEATLRNQKVYLSKLNLILVQILKQEWPHNWPNFIPDIVDASMKGSETLCENNMHILRLLSEEIFDFSAEQMTAAKVKELKERLNAEFSNIFSLCNAVLENARQIARPSLVTATLQTLLKFLNWIPLMYVFNTNIIDQLVNVFFPEPQFRNDALKCLTEIAGLDPRDIGERYDQQFQKLFFDLIPLLANVEIPVVTPSGGMDVARISSETDMAMVHACLQGGDQQHEVFLQDLCMFITTFCKVHLGVLEATEQLHPHLLEGLGILVQLSRIDDMETFKICLEYWQWLGKDLYDAANAAASMDHPLMLQRNNPQAAQRRMLYDEPILSRARIVMIDKMARPEEVLIVEDDNGEIVKEVMKDTDAIMLYKSMRETLIYLTNLNVENTESIMQEKLRRQVDGSDWDVSTSHAWNKLNTLCWAIGSISGAMIEEEEKRFLVTVIKDLLSLCETKKGKDNKAVIASNIMYVVGQYPRFLRQHWKFLKTVVNKLFEFMHETHPGVQDMACDTFLKIAEKCKRKFVTQQLPPDPQLFIIELLDDLGTHINDLEQHQIQTFYEAVGHMVSAETAPERREELVNRLFALPNRLWQTIVAQAEGDAESLKSTEVMKQITSILRTNQRVAQSLGHPYAVQLYTIYEQMLQVYKFYSEMISSAVSSQGQYATTHHNVKAMRSVKKETLKLIETYVSHATRDTHVIADTFVPPLLDPVLGDYLRNAPDARDPEVLSLLACIVNTCKEAVTPKVPEILGAVFECTLAMITVNFEDYPDIRINFFKLIESINKHCFEAFLHIPAEHFKLVIDSVVWAFKHHERNISETGLAVCKELLGKIEGTHIAQQFYEAYFLQLLQDVFVVLTDTLHKTGFKSQSEILQYLFKIVIQGGVAVPLFDTAAAAHENNTVFLQHHFAALLKEAFPHLEVGTIQTFVTGLFQTDDSPAKTLAAFKAHLRDFLVQMKEFEASDNAGLYAEETEATQATAAAAETARVASVPGLMNPQQALADESDML